MDAVDFVIVALASWRIASLFVFETGPADVFLHIRNFVGVVDDPDWVPTGFWPKLFSCLWCAGVWSAAAAFIVWWLFWPLAAILAASALVMFLEQNVRR